jgi:hypothetical protein
MQAAPELRQPNVALLEGLDAALPADVGRAAANEALVAHAAEVLLSWCGSVADTLSAHPQPLPRGEEPAAEVSSEALRWHVDEALVANTSKKLLSWRVVVRSVAEPLVAQPQPLGEQRKDSFMPLPVIDAHT